MNETLLSKLPSIGKLLQRDQQLREDRVTVHSYPGFRGNVDRSLARPWHMLPDIRQFVIKLAPHDGLLLIFGIRKKGKPRLEFHKGKNAPANKYLDYMFKRLTREVELGKYEMATRTIGILMNSTSYQVASYNKIAKNWHRKKTIYQVESELRKINRLCRSKSTDLQYKRVYIPKIEGKPDGPQRPLGVPTLEGRVYLHMYNNCITQGRMVTEGKAQHGYLPKRGVVTAWLELMKLLRTENNIYEADFKGFFDNIERTGLTKVLKDLGFPISEQVFIENINKSRIQLTDEDKTDEFKARQMEYISRCIQEEIQPEGKYGEPMRKDIIAKYGSDDPRTNKKLMEHLMEGAGLYGEVEDIMWRPQLVLLKDLEVQGAMRSSVKEEGFYDMLKGVPQGAPTSCSLATLTLRPLEQTKKVILYADDVIYFPSKSTEDPIEELSQREMGIEVNPQKSRGLKKDGEGLVDSFKFLGFSYYPRKKKQLQLPETSIFIAIGFVLDTMLWEFPLLTALIGWCCGKYRNYGISDRFQANTRKGANLEFTNKESFMNYLYNAREMILEDPYLTDKVSRQGLAEWLKEGSASGDRLKGKIAILFVQKMRKLNKDDIKKYSGFKIRMPLTGFIFSRMQSNSGNISIKQDFRLKRIENSGVDLEWGSYAGKHIVPINSISIFTASSFATHDLMERLKKMKQKRTVAKGMRVTYVKTHNTRNKITAKEFPMGKQEFGNCYSSDL